VTNANDTSWAAGEPVGEVLARLRRGRRMTGAQLAELVGMSQPKISRIERGKGVADPDDIDRIARELGADEELIRDLVERAGSPQNRMTDWRPVVPGLANIQRDLGAWESTTRDFRMFDSAIVHGLLQTSGYATSVLTAFQRLLAQEGHALSEAAALEAVSARIKRQEVVADHRKNFRFVMAESVFVHRVCPPADMLAQIDALRKAAARENVSVKIVPVEVMLELPPQHGFMILDDRLVEVDLYNTGLTSRGKLDLLRYANVFDAFDALATEDIEPILAKYDNVYLDQLRSHQP